MISFKSLSKLDERLLDESARGIGARDIVEVGARLGDSSIILCKISKENGGMLYSIECDPQIEWLDRMNKEGLSGYFRMVKTFSPWIDLTQIPSTIDYLLIDGDHRTSYCIADFHFLSPLVRAGGLVAIHDTWLNEANVGKMVIRAIKMILEDYPNFKLYRECHGKFGMMVLRKEYEKMQ